MPVTYQTKIEDHPYLNEYADLFGRLERQLFVDQYINNKKLAELKKLYIANNQITARQFNAIQYNLKGKILSLEEVRKERIETIKDQIKSTGKWITNKEKQRTKLARKLLKLKPIDEKYTETNNKYHHLKFVLHQKKRRLRNLEHKLTKLQGDQENKAIRICFGSRKLFKAQHNLKENGYTNHTNWLKDWRTSRNSQFYIIGSKDETMGNQTCTYSLNNALRLRVADCFEKEFGKYVTFQDVSFPYGQEVLDQSREVLRTKDKKGKPKKESKSAISYRFIRKGKAWYIHANTNPEYPEVTTNRWNGAIGIDLNAGFLVAGEVDRYGNPLGEIIIPVQMYSRSSKQITASLGDAIKQIVLLAKEKGKPIVIELLDFSQKKQTLREMGTGYARMLSGFAYNKFKMLIQSRASREGVELIKKNPFATSLAGQFKFMARYGLSSHGAAACVIARRGLGFRLEKPPQTQDTVINLPAFKRNQTRGSRWVAIARKIKHDLTFNIRLALLSADR